MIHRPPTTNLVWQERLPRGLMLLVTLIAAWLRLWRLPAMPPGLTYDEAFKAADAVWMIRNHVFPLFFVGNTGHEPLFVYLEALAFLALGATPFTIRLVSACFGLLTVALLYRLVVTLFSHNPDRHWLGLIAAAGLGLSHWHLMMSRMGWRAVLVPFFVVLTMYLFWLALQKQSWGFFALAGVALGLSQYTYITARLLPLVFGLFVIAWFFLRKKVNAPREEPLPDRHVWLGLLVMAAASLIVFLPLGVYFVHNPSLFLSRSGDVSLLSQLTSGELSLTGHLAKAIQVFGVYHPPSPLGPESRPPVDWLCLTGFVIGLVMVLGTLCHPASLFLGISLFVLWLPGVLSLPAGHANRASGLLPIYFIMATMGLLALARGIGRLLRFRATTRWSYLVAFLLVIVVSGGLTGYDYFVRWANHPALYVTYNQQLVDLATLVIDRSDEDDVLMPTSLFFHPLTRFLLWDQFQVSDVPPVANPNRTGLLVDDPNVPSSAYVWLGRGDTGQAIAYVGRPVQPGNLAGLLPNGETLSFTDPRDGQPLVIITPVVNLEPALAEMTDWQPVRQVVYDWDHQVSLVGFEVTPEYVQQGQSPTLTLYWRSLVGQPFEGLLFIQLLDGRGDPVGQWVQGSPTRHLRWQTGLLDPDQHVLWMAPQAQPGTYLVRVGMLDPTMEQRLPVYAGDGTLLGDSIIGGLFYVSPDEGDPRQPDIRLDAMLGDQIEFLGYSLAPGQVADSTWSVRLFWRARQQVADDYTTFLQLLDDRGQLVTGWDSQPLAGQYPTSNWSPGEIVVDEMSLPLPGDLAPGRYRLVTGMYDLESGARLPAFDVNDKRLDDDMIMLLQTSLPQ